MKWLRSFKAWCGTCAKGIEHVLNTDHTYDDQVCYQCPVCLHLVFLTVSEAKAKGLEELVKPKRLTDKQDEILNRGVAQQKEPKRKFMAKPRGIRGLREVYWKCPDCEYANKDSQAESYTCDKCDLVVSHDEVVQAWALSKAVYEEERPTNKLPNISCLFTAFQDYNTAITRARYNVSKFRDAQEALRDRLRQLGIADKFDWTEEE